MKLTCNTRAWVYEAAVHVTRPAPAVSAFVSDREAEDEALSPRYALREVS